MSRASFSPAIRFVVLIGFVSLFADMTYEGARSVTGPYLGMLGASAFLVSAVGGLGELAGYTLRLFSGRLSDKTGRYWTITVIGYLLNLLSVPALALTGSWQSAAGLVIVERVGRAIRNPPRDAMLSHATHEIGRGWGFGLHEAMDQTGALIGPLLIALVLSYKGTYRVGFAVLLVPAVVSLLVLVLAQRQYPDPMQLEAGLPSGLASGMSARFWLYTIGAGLIAAGYADFSLIAFHFSRTAIFSQHTIPLTYALAMGVSALAALIFGKLFDHVGLASAAIGIIGAAAFAPLIFLSNSRLALGGMLLWGMGLGVQESALRAHIATMVPSARRASAYGVFDTVFGVFWFAGSLIMGGLYGHSMTALITFSVLTQVASVPLLLSGIKNKSQI
jgi:MFS family permease